VLVLRSFENQDAGLADEFRQAGVHRGGPPFCHGVALVTSLLSSLSVPRAKNLTETDMGESPT
jgi:hypothetical protein